MQLLYDNLQSWIESLDWFNPTHSWLFINKKGSLRVWISNQLQEYFQLDIFILWISVFTDYQLIFHDSD